MIIRTVRLWFGIKGNKKVGDEEMSLFKMGKVRSIGRLAVTGLLAASLLVLSGCGASSDANGDQSAKVLKFGSDIAYAPFEFMEDGTNNPAGFDIELATAVAEDMGYKAQFETAAFDGLIASLQSGTYDAVISAMTITDKRAEEVLFSDRYFKATQYIAFKKGASFKSLDDLKGKKIGVQLNTTGQEAVEKAGMETHKYDTTPDALSDLVNGGVDAVVADSPVVLYFIKQNSNANIEWAPANTPDEFYGVAFKKDNTEIANKFNTSLQKLIDNGKYKEIYKKWFNEDPPSLSK